MIGVQARQNIETGISERRVMLADVDRVERRDLVTRLQQLTGPVMAKGLEDTAFYR